MTRSAIATRKKKPPTPAERLHALDPDLAALFDQWEESLNQEYDLALNDNPAPPILDAEVALATEGWRLLDTAAVMYATIDDVQVTADASRAALARLALDVFVRPGYTTYQQPALPAPPPDDDTEDYRNLRADHVGYLNMDALISEAEGTPEDTDRPGWWPQPLMVADPEGLPVGDDGLPEGTPPWDDPEGAQMVVERPRASMGSGARWWARITAVSAAVSTIGFGLWMAGLHLLGGGS